MSVSPIDDFDTVFIQSRNPDELVRRQAIAFAHQFVHNEVLRITGYGRLSHRDASKMLKKKSCYPYETAGKLLNNGEERQTALYHHDKNFEIEETTAIVNNLYMAYSLLKDEPTAEKKWIK